MPGATRPRAPFPTLLGLAVVLIAMALVLTLVWLNTADANAVCTTSGSSSGECLLETQIDRVRGTLLGGGAATLLVGGVVAAVAGLAQLLWDRRR